MSQPAFDPVAQAATLAAAETHADDATPLTTKGDILTFTTVKARLGVGTDGQALVADSAVAAGIKWATLALGLSSGVYDEITYALDIATPVAVESPSWS